MLKVTERIKLLARRCAFQVTSALRMYYLQAALQKEISAGTVSAAFSCHFLVFCISKYKRLNIILAMILRRGELVIHREREWEDVEGRTYREFKELICLLVATGIFR